jgi:hypothetical protein
MPLFRATVILHFLPVSALVWAQSSPVITLVANAEADA